MENKQKPTIEEAAKKYANNWTVEPLEYNRVQKHFMDGAKWASIETEQLQQENKRLHDKLQEWISKDASQFNELEQLRQENEKLKKQVKELKEENERLTDILENRLIGGPECDVTRASDAYFYLGDMLNVQAGGSVIDTVQQLQQRIKELEGK